MNRDDLIREVAGKTGMAIVAAKKTVEAIIDSVKEALAAGNSVELHSFGSFKLAQRAARNGVNPQTGKKIVIAARTVPTFKAGKALKLAVNADDTKKKSKK